MKERPINLTAQEVRAILDERKEQFRRPIKPQPHGGVHWYDLAIHKNSAGWTDGHGKSLPGCLGRPGDRLWVRETWQPCSCDWKNCPGVIYKADGMHEATVPGKWRPSTHMPRWASRLTLEITGVKAQRVQSITEEDARAEGVESDEFYDRLEQFDSFAPLGSIGRPNLREEFWARWNLNAQHGFKWADNPWVYAYEYKRVEEAGR